MRVQIVIQPEDEIFGDFEMDVLPRVGDDVMLQSEKQGLSLGYKVTSVHWTFDTSLRKAGAELVSVSIAVERVSTRSNTQTETQMDAIQLTAEQAASRIARNLQRNVSTDYERLALIVALASKHIQSPPSEGWPALVAKIAILAGPKSYPGFDSTWEQVSNMFQDHS